MLDEIKKFYERTKVKQVEWNITGDVPLTFVHVFTKAYPRLPAIPLPKADRTSSLENILSLRVSTREFADEPLSLDRIGAILRSCKVVDMDRVPERRTYPSAGGRFPVEIYLLAYNITDLARGAYHYNMREQKLELLWEKDLVDRQREIISTNLKNPAATIVLTSVISRSEVKYQYKAYPFSLLEAGHMGQNIILAVAEQGLCACPVSGFVDDAVKEILDLTDDELPIYSISLGHKKGCD